MKVLETILLIFVFCDGHLSAAKNWSPWVPWSLCTKQCAGGSQSRTRSCVGGGIGICLGALKQVQTCNIAPCKGTWSVWAVWSPCPVSCGSGQRRRSRGCIGPGSCLPFTESFQTGVCNSQPCVAKWAAWGVWSSCSRSCGGGDQRRTRMCTGPGACLPASASQETKVCNPQICIGTWSMWGAWSTCTKTCAVGRQTRARTCSGSPNCPGIGEQSNICNTQACPVGGVDSIFGVWSLWSTCTRPCGGGVRKRSRTCIRGVCTFSDKEQQEQCNSSPCGQWTPWEQWTKCSASCGGGVKSRTRKCQGGPCPDDQFLQTESLPCSPAACPLLPNLNLPNLFGPQSVNMNSIIQKLSSFFLQSFSNPNNIFSQLFSGAGAPGALNNLFGSFTNLLPPALRNDLQKFPQAQQRSVLRRSTDRAMRIARSRCMPGFCT